MSNFTPLSIFCEMIKMMDPEKLADFNFIVEAIRRVMESGFYGKLEFTFQKGYLHHMQTTMTEQRKK